MNYFGIGKTILLKRYLINIFKDIIKMNIIQLLYMDTNINNIKKMYDKLTYFDQYGGSLVLFIVITITVIILISYFNTMTNIQPIVDDWPNQRCNPAIIPFAGLITHPEGISATDYTLKNFNYCTQNILSGITGSAVQPLTFITNTLRSIANIIQASIQSIRAMFDKVRSSMQTVSEEIMGRLMNIMMPLMQIIISFKDLISKIQGTMTAGLFTLLGSYYTLKALMGAIVQFIISILMALAILIAVFWIVPFTWGAAIANTVIFIAIAIPLAIILAFMVNTLHVDTGFRIPKIKCFDKDTLIEINNKNKIKISDIQVGDILSDNNIVTAIIKVATEGSIMYKLNNIIVSDTHIVKYKDKWIPVCQHPNATIIDKYNEEYLFCLNTTNKIIKINNTIFTDWDEIYDKTLDKVINNNIIPVSINSIHKYLDCGFFKDTQIILNDGSVVSIDQVKINDILENGEKVYGIVEIDGSNLVEQFKYNLGENNFVEGYAPNFNDKDKVIIINKNKKLYNLLTDNGTFKIKNIVIKDYNATIDRFLENNK